MLNQTRRALLRDRTSEVHASLDQMVGGFAEPAHYLAYLRGMARFRMGIEARLAASDGRLEGFEGVLPARLTSDLAADLADLDFPPQPLHEDAKPFATGDIPGVLYVLHGSTLGARLLVKRAEAIGFTSTNGARHLARQAGDNGWRAFLQVLETAEPFDAEATTAAARQTFAAAEAAFRDSFDAG